MGQPVLEVSQVEQYYRVGFWLKPVRVLHGISLEVPARSIFGFLGANGAGKTTLIQLIAGIRRPTSGRVLVGGAEATTAAARSRIGYLPERPYFYEHLTGEGLLAFFGALSGLDRARNRARAEQVLATVGLADARKTELRRYSKGMLQRIGIAQALLHDPELLILDEPMSGLDPVGRREMRELILRLAREGKTIFFSSHVIPDVEAICDHVALIRKGNLLGCGPIEGFLSRGATGSEIAFTGIPSAGLSDFGEFEAVRELPDGFRALVRGAEPLNSALSRLLARKARILSVVPVRPSLEDLFEAELS